MSSKSLFNDFCESESPLDAPVDTTPIITTSNWTANVFPTLTNFPYRIAIVGDVPDKDALFQQTPFVGMAGKLINGMLARAGIIREACFLGYLGDSLQNDLDQYKPNIILALGKGALYHFKGVTQLDNWRGSLFISTPETASFKCIATYSPTECWKMYDRTGLVWFDICKCLSEATSPILTLPQRNLSVNLSYEELLTRLAADNISEQLLSVDLEGYWNNLSCCSIASSSGDSYIVPFANLDSSNYWSEQEEIEIWRAFARLMSNGSVPKVFQNGLYDRFVLQYGFGITVQGNIDDTMLKWAEKWCELEKGLGIQASILTREPYWKFERKSDTKEAYYTYCCKDSAVTYELNEKLTPMLDARQFDHYHLNIALLNPILYMELRGIKYDKATAAKRLADINRQIYIYQSRLDALAGCGVLKAVDKKILAKTISETCCYKRDPGTFKSEFKDHESRLRAICQDPNLLSEEEVGYVNVACKWSMNIKSDKFKTFLYTTLGLPKQIDPKTKSITTDYEALLKISKKVPHKAIDLALDLGELRTRSQLLGIAADPDGRVRCGYNIVGTETGRITCYTSPTGSGYNLQTMPDTNALKAKEHPLYDGLRSLFQADEGYYLFQCDLSGADGWTVGAYLAALGDPTMLDDLLAGIKPAQRICYMLRHGMNSLSGKGRPEVKLLLKEINKEDWDYFACKGIIWGICYTMGAKKADDHIFVQSEGKVHLGIEKATLLQQAVFQVYNVHLWHRATQRMLDKKPELVSPNGHRRRFFGRATDILGQALAHEPQVNTTYATNLAAYKLWTDSDNRIVTSNDSRTSSTMESVQSVNGFKSRIRLRVEPLHQVHDALIVQAKIEDTQWAISKLKQWFANEIVIAGISITIPFGGTYGPSWGEQPFKIE